MPHCPHHPEASAGSWTPQSGRDAGKLFVTCTKFLGQGALGANPKGYCTWKELAETPQPVQEPRSAPAVAPNSSDGSPRLRAAIAALQAASYGPGSPAEVMDRAATYYHKFLKPAFLSDVPVPVTPKVVPVTPKVVP